MKLQHHQEQLNELCLKFSDQPKRLNELNQEQGPSSCLMTRLDICARGLWQAGQMAFFDVRVFNPTAKRYVNQKISKTYEVIEREKKKLYNKRKLQIEHGSFMPLVMSATGGMGRKCKKFYVRLAEMISYKRGTSYIVIASWVRRKITRLLIKSIVMCLRGHRLVFYNDTLKK